ncbi:MAG: potassium/proton antiporter [Bacteriovoracaceae bacterium]|nr:potassium/proton antiporter [Bacteriovoracaceae bacterium]
MIGFQFQNHSLESILLVSSLLLIFSVLSSRISSKFGVPALLLFLAIGMLAGSEGPGNIAFDNYPLSFAIGSVCLAIIIFDGGLQTSWKSIRPILPLGISLSFVGTVVTGIATGLFAHYALNLSLTEGLLLGAIVSSTDAAAVFNILGAKSLALKGSLKQTLEFEAGSNDPVAIFLTVSVLSLAMNKNNTGITSMILMFVMQGGIGLLVGWLGGKGIRWLINNVGIEFEGLYSVLLLGLVICLFAGVSAVGGSGFLAVYVAGLVVGNSDLLHKNTIVRFSDGIAWIAQILVFLTLGLLCYPSHLLLLWKEGLILALFMMFVARPLSVLIAAPGSALDKSQRLFVSWVGLRGAAPIILATLPMGAGFPNSEYYFNLVFFVVLFSVIAQGISIPWVAKKVGVTERLKNKPLRTEGLLPSGFITVEMEIKEDALAVDRRIVDLSLPGGVLLTSIEREDRFLIPRGDTILLAGDRISGLARPSSLESLEEVFGDARPVT